MGYKITYGPARPGGSAKHAYVKKLLMKLVIAALIFSLRFTSFGQKLRLWLIPGDPAVTVAAWEKLIEDVTGSEGIGVAIETFCTTIINDDRPA